MRGIVHYGINSIYAVRCGGLFLECRFKGKKLKNDESWYNPLAPGDEVEVVPDIHSPDKGAIVSRYERRNYFSRLNKKSNSPQVLAANIDRIMPVLSASLPPFRPRFLDRVLVMARRAGIPAVIIVNKIDEGVSSELSERLAVYGRLGYETLRCSARTGQGIEDLRITVAGTKTVFVGPSGTGKSSIINSLVPGINLRTGGISLKYERGTHTTCFSLMVEVNDDTVVIDTPGVREVHVYGLTGRELRDSFPDFAEYAGKCAFAECMHADEQPCAVKDAVEEGRVDYYRYESYIRMLDSLIEERYERD